MHAETNIAWGTDDQCPHPTSTGQVGGPRGRARYAKFFALVALIATSLLGAPAGARADRSHATEAAPYEELLDQAVSAFEANDFERAHALFGQAYALKPNARVSRGLGIAALRLEHYTQAQRWLSSALSDRNQALTPTQRDEVTKLMAWMQTSLGVLRLHWGGATPPHGNEVLVDDERVDQLTLWLTPGAHQLRVQAPGFETRDERIELIAGREQTRDLRLTPHASTPELITLSREDMVGSESVASGALNLRPAPTAPERRDRDSSVLSRWWFWTAVGVVVAGGVTAAVLVTAKPAERPYEMGGEGGVIKARGVLP